MVSSRSAIGNPAWAMGAKKCVAWKARSACKSHGIDHFGAVAFDLYGKGVVAVAFTKIRMRIACLQQLSKVHGITIVQDNARGVRHVFPPLAREQVALVPRILLPAA